MEWAHLWKERARKSTESKHQTRDTNTTRKASHRGGTNDLEQATAEVHVDVTKYSRVPTVDLQHRQRVVQGEAVPTLAKKPLGSRFKSSVVYLTSL